MIKPLARSFAVMLGAALAAACAVGPDYHRPPLDTAANFKEAGDWKPSEPNDVLSRGPWWKIFNDDVLDGLEAQIDISNQNVKAAEAAFEQSRALVAQARAGFWPTIAASFGAQRQGAPEVITNRRRHAHRHDHARRKIPLRRAFRPIGTLTSGAASGATRKAMSPRRRRIPPHWRRRGSRRRRNLRPITLSCAHRINWKSCWTIRWSPKRCR